MEAIAFGPGIRTASIAIEHGDFTEIIAGQERTENLFAAIRHFDNFHLSLEHQADAIGGITLAKKIGPRATGPDKPTGRRDARAPSSEKPSKNRLARASIFTTNDSLVEFPFSMRR